MKYFCLIIMLLCFISCGKFLEEPYDRTPIDHNEILESNATITETRSYGCYPRQWMIHVDTPVTNFPPLYIHKDRMFPNNLHEVWAENLPDTLNAPGQRVKILFHTYDQLDWLICSGRLVPNNIRITFAQAVFFEDDMEVIDTISKCNQLVKLKVNKHYPPYLGSTPVLASNLPESLKTIGRKFRCLYRFAGSNEHEGCRISVFETQLVIMEVK